MLNGIKRFLAQQGGIEPPGAIEHRLKLATAALLIEMMRQDGQVHESEIQAVRAALMKKFALTEVETDELYRQARIEAREATDFHRFTSLIARNYSSAQKFQLIEYLWQIAYADGELDSHEEHMIRRIADLIYVSHLEFIKAKHNALALVAP